MYCEQTFTANASYHGIHLDNGCFRVLFKELFKIGIIPSYPAASVHLEFRLFVPRSILDLAEQINVSDIKKLSINVIVQCFFTAHQIIHMIQVNLMQ